MNTKSLIAKIALYLSVIAMIAFSVDALAQPTNVSITAPASDGMQFDQGGTVTFIGTATDPDGLALTYAWSFSDGTSQNGQIVTYQIPATATAGSTITATLTVTNSNNVQADSTASRSVTVVSASDRPTQVIITAPASDGTTVAQGGTVTFTGTATDPNGLALTYTWNFSDGTSTTSQTGSSVTYQIPATATVGSTITATLNVKNSTNVLADSQPTRSVTVVALPVSSNLIYVTNFFGNTVTLIDPASNNVIATLTVNSPLFGQDVSWDGKYAYLVYTKDGVPHGTVSVIDPNSHTVTAKADVGNGPYSNAITPDGKSAYTTNFDYYGTVTVTDTATNSVTATVTVGRYPLGVSVTPDEKSAYVANYLDGTVSVIDVASNTVSKTISVGRYPFRVGNVLTASAVPFSAFSVQNLSVSPNLRALYLKSIFTLDQSSVGIAPSVQNTILNIGNYVLIIPPGAFKLDWWGAYRFNGNFKDVYLEAVIQPSADKQYSLDIYAYYSNIIWINYPLTVQLTIGGDNGSTVVTPNIIH